ncbi:MAG: DUF4340 domain-containing protein [Desulfobacterales bacterium]
MKLKKETIVLAVVIAALGLYIALRKTDRTLYELPSIPVVEAGEISRIEITGPQGKILLEKADDRWKLPPDGFDADAGKVDRLLDAIDDLALTALVSESGNYARYDLDHAKRVILKAWSGDRLVREIEVGKEAGTFNHTHVKLPEDPKVYHARGDFRPLVDRPLGDFRDKRVMTFDRTAAKVLDVAAGETPLRLTFTETPAGGENPESDPEEAGTDSESKAGTNTAWTTPEGREVEAAAVNDIIGFMADLECESFMDPSQKETLTDPMYRLTVTADKDYSVSIFPKASEEANTYPALSSESPYPFELSRWKVDDLKENIDAISGAPESEADTPAPSPGS